MSSSKTGTPLESTLLDVVGAYLAPEESIRRALAAAFEWAPLEVDESSPAPPPSSAASSSYEEEAPPMLSEAAGEDEDDEAEAPYGWRDPRAGGKVIVIDKAALVHGILRSGQEMSRDLSSARWLVEWLDEQSSSHARRPSQDESRALENMSAFDDGVPIIISRSLRNTVLPAAVELARRTVGSDRASMRHLIFALLAEPPSTLGPLSNFLTPGRVVELKHRLVERIAKDPVVGEDLDEWRRIAEGPGPAESVGTLADAPALVDALGRQAFADVLATRIKQVYEILESGERDTDSTFILHIDGPWGSGKTSILNFLKRDLQSSNPPWFVIEFNAWQNQQRKPAWWPLIAQVGGALKRQSWRKYFLARWAWAWWNLKMRWVPVLLSAVLVVAFLYFALGAASQSPPVPPGGTPPKAEPATQATIDELQKGWQALLAMVALGGLVLTSSRALFFGSKSAAEAYAQSSAEPFRPIIKLFERLISAIGHPVAIFIDDLDRCEAAYVIELLEGIQTLLRTATVVYVVAGDRKWICSSFEKRYVDFGGQIGSPGRPLGHLFLDKVFQLSTAIPRLSSARQEEYWRTLLDRKEGGNAAPIDTTELKDESEQELKGETRYEGIQAKIDKAGDPIKAEALRAAAAKQITSPEAIEASEHRLQALADLLEPNPRAMKRLVNAYGLNQARAFLEGRSVDVEALARWTIVELRWPVLAEYLAENWTDIDAGDLRLDNYRDDVRRLLADADVRRVFGEDGEKGRLLKQTLGPILGETGGRKPKGVEPQAAA